MFKKLMTIAGILCIGALTACAGTAGGNPAPAGDTAWTAEEEPREEPEANTPALEPTPVPTPGITAEIPEPRPGGDIVTSGDLDLLQTRPLQPGDTIVILHTNMGHITMRFFPEETPMAYENFVTHAREGYYDGVIFHRVIKDFMIQGGDPLGTGMGGESIWGYGFPHEFSDYLRHFRGAVAMAHAIPTSLGSQFYIVQNTRLAPHMQEDLEWAWENQDFLLGTNPEDGVNVYMRDLLNKDMLEAYFRYGGTPFLDSSMNENFHTVFAQVIDGMDVVDAIAAVEVGANDRPVEEVIIESTTVITVSACDGDFELSS